MELFFAIAFTHFVALLSPGPDFFLILTTLLNQNKTAAQKVCWGIALGNAFILLMVFSGWHLLGKIDVWILTCLKWVGACYLVYLCYLCFRYAHIRLDLKSQCQHTNISSLKSILLGLQSSLLNPKNIFFYSSLTLLVSEKFNIYQKIAISLWMVLVVLFWNMFLLRLLSHPRWISALRKYSQWLYYLSGICFLGFASLLIYL
ncbi:LysE family translocator [Acinetobacter ihumii]|uniref:LysE family translocator n=1 Tax=Acinetobacter ihumii TaxID=2483802 RepID=UPI0010313D0F|nr:LysE family translocator [Acinetobacter ihumii]